MPQPLPASKMKTLDLSIGIGVCGIVTACVVWRSIRLPRPSIPATHWSRTGGIVGHRGARVKQCPTGNTMSAFKSASKDAVALELDVQITADDEIVVFHDLRTKRHLQGEDSVVMKMTLAEIQSRTFVAEADQGERVPKLEDILLYAKSKDLKVLVELKGWSRSMDLCRRTLEVIDSCGYRDQVMIISFNPIHVYDMRRLAHDMPTALIVGDGLIPDLLGGGSAVKFLTKWLDQLFIWSALKPSLLPTLLGSTTVAADYHMFTPSLVKEITEQGFTTDAWTVNRQEDASSLAAIGVNLITTDIPSIRL